MKKREVALFLAVILVVVFSLNFISAATRTCYTCNNCTAEIGIAIDGDIIQLDNSLLNTEGTCINFSGMDNVTFDCQNYGNYIQGDKTGTDYGIVFSNSSRNNTLVNCNVSHFANGIFVSEAQSKNNTFFSLISNNNTAYGIYLGGTGYHNLTNLVINNNSGNGFFIFASKSIFKDISVDYNSGSGIRLQGNSNNFTNVTANNNTNYGFYFSSSTANLILNSSFKDNNWIDVFPYPSGAHCDNNLTNVNGSGNLPIELYNHSVTLANRTFSELMLCNADNSNISNITIISSAWKQNNGIFISSTSNSVFTDINSSRVYMGMHLSYTNDLLIANSTFNNDTYGITDGLGTNSGNNLTNITANFNRNAISITGVSTDISTLTTITAKNNTWKGLIIGSTYLTNATIQDNLWDISVITTTCNLNFTNVNGSGGNPIEYYNSSNITIENKVLAELIICSAKNVTISNIQIRGSGAISNNLLMAIKVNNSNFTNINVSTTLYGLYLYYSYGNNVSNVSATNNHYFGTYVSYSENNVFSNLTIKGTDHSSDEVNSGAGIFLQQAHNNTIKDSQIRSSFKEAIYFSSAHQNNLTHNIIENHSKGGMRFAGNSKKNFIYNNFFNNSLNYNDTTSLTNYFNITRTSATNIVGGRNIGGNYWADINGTGFSEINCVDEDEDNICDASYSLGDDNYDFLPLTLVSFSLPGAATSNPGGPSSTTETAKVTTASPEEPIVMEISRSGSVVRKITVNVNTNLSDVSLKVSEISTSEANFDISLLGSSYESFKIEIINITNSDIENAVIEFRVNKTWLLENNFTKEDVVLYRKPTSETNWSSLETTYLYDEDGYSRFSAVSPGFSTFVVFVSTAECIPAEKRCVENEVHFCLGNKKWLVSEVCDYQCKDGECVEKGLQVNLNPLVVYPIIGIVVVGVLISFLAQRMPKKRKGKRSK